MRAKRVHLSVPQSSILT